MNETPDYVAEAVDFLRDKLHGKGNVYLGFSGGKDSIVTERLLSLSGLPYKTYHSFTGIDAPEVVKFIRENYPACNFVRPKQTFWHLITTHNPPANFSRWCCKKLKKEPSAKIQIPLRVLGQRAEESVKRSKYPRVNHFDKLNQTHHYPILDWKEWQVWEFIEQQGLKYPILYDCGFSRLGCIFVRIIRQSRTTGTRYTVFAGRNILSCSRSIARCGLKKGKSRGGRCFSQPRKSSFLSGTKGMSVGIKRRMKGVNKLVFWSMLFGVFIGALFARIFL